MKSTLALFGAFVICPCHFPITLALLATTGFGAFAVANSVWVYSIAVVAFTALAVLGIFWFKQERQRAVAKAHGHPEAAACTTCDR